MHVNSLKCNACLFIFYFRHTLNGLFNGVEVASFQICISLAKAAVD